MRKFILISICALFLTPALSSGWANWQTYSTDDFTVFYGPGMADRGLRLLDTMELYKDIPRKISGNTLLNVPVVLEDCGQESNGFTAPIYNTIHVFDYDDSSIPSEQWYRSVAMHEYSHMLQMTTASGLPWLLSKGISPALYPNFLNPTWFLEGFAVYTESQFSPYEGRLNDGLHDAIVAAKAADKSLPDIMDATYAPLQFPYYDGFYVYGGDFFRYLSDTYGGDKFSKLFKFAGGSVPYYLNPLLPVIGMDSAMHRAYGKSADTLWDEWRADKTGKGKAYKVDGTRLTNDGWYKSGCVFDGGKLYYLKNYAVKSGALKDFQFYQIACLDPASGRESVITGTTAGYALGLKASGGRLYYAVFAARYGYANTTNLGYGYYTEVHERDLASGHDKKITEGAVRAFCTYRDNGIICVLDPPDYDGSQVVAMSENGLALGAFFTHYVIDGIDASGDTVIVSARVNGELHSLYRLDMDSRSMEPIVKTPYEQKQPQIIDNGEKVIFNADYNSEYSEYCCDLLSGRVSRMTSGGYAGDAAYDPDSRTLYFCGINSSGFDIYSKQAAYEDYSLPDAKPSEKPVFQDYKPRRGGYSDVLATLAPLDRYPVLVLDKNQNVGGAGLALGGNDTLLENSYQASCSYSWTLHRVLFSGMISSTFFEPAQVSLSSDNYDVNGRQSSSLEFSYPVFLSINDGLKNVNAGANLSVPSGLDNADIAPFISLGFGTPYNSAGLQFSEPIVTDRIGTYEKQGTYGNFSARQYTGDSELDLSISAMYDYHNPDARVTPVRGYSSQIDSDRGGGASLDYTRPIIKVRRGLWNPNVYLEDICGTLFVDSATGHEPRDLQLSGGAELTAEVKLLFAIQLEAGAGVAYTKDYRLAVEPVLRGLGTF